MKRYLVAAVASLAVAVAVLTGLSAVSAATSSSQAVSTGPNSYNVAYNFTTDELPVLFTTLAPPAGVSAANSALSFISCSTASMASCGVLPDADPAAGTLRIDAIPGIDGNATGQTMTITIGVWLGCSVPSSAIVTGSQNDAGLSVQLPCNPSYNASCSGYGCVPGCVYGNACVINYGCMNTNLYGCGNNCSVYGCGNVHPYCTNAYSPTCGVSSLQNCAGVYGCGVNNCGAYGCNNCGLYGCSQGCNNCGYYGSNSVIYVSPGIPYKGPGMGAVIFGGSNAGPQYPMPQQQMPPAPPRPQGPPPVFLPPSTGEGVEDWVE